MATIGIVGGGQLGALTAITAQKRGHTTLIFAGENEVGSSGTQVSSIINGVLKGQGDTKLCDVKRKNELISGKYVTGDPQIDLFIKKLLQSKGAATSEWENVPAKILQYLKDAGIQTCPGSEVFLIAQNRIREKTLANSLGIQTCSWVAVSTFKELEKAYLEMFHGEEHGDCILKTATGGYDGKGQVRVCSMYDCMMAWTELSEKGPLILEKKVPFQQEISVIVGRNQAGEMVHFHPAENIHENGILRFSITPARISQEIERKSIEAAKKIASGLDLVGILAVEMFVNEDGEILFNEIAPRPHNSGHQTLESHNMSQYDVLVDILTGEPLRSPELISPAVLMNLLGDEISLEKTVSSAVLETWGDFRKIVDGDRIWYNYGKGAPKAGRKMGHVTQTVDHPNDVETTLLGFKQILTSI